MDSTKNRANVRHVVLGVLISSMLLLTSVLEKQNLSALTSGDRYTGGFSHGEQQAATDFQNNSTFNPVCVKHTSYYCAGYVKGYNATWNNLAAKGATSNPTPPATSPPSKPSNTNTSAPSIPYSVKWVAFIVLLIILIMYIAWKLKHKSGKYKERKGFSDSIKEMVLEKQHHRCADC